MIARNSIGDLPPFPDDVPTAPIARITLSKILKGDPDEAASALEACRTFGFFYLDLSSTPLGEDLLDEAEDLLQLSYKAFDHPNEEKDQYELIKGVSLFGYKYVLIALDQPRC
jgi:isopenicillin N synthase-like dioxygenase